MKDLFKKSSVVFLSIFLIIPLTEAKGIKGGRGNSVIKVFGSKGSSSTKEAKNKTVQKTNAGDTSIKKKFYYFI